MIGLDEEKFANYMTTGFLIFVTIYATLSLLSGCANKYDETCYIKRVDGRLVEVCEKKDGQQEMAYIDN